MEEQKLLHSSSLTLEIDDSNNLMELDANNINSYKIDAKAQRYPFCLVWTPIPVLTFLLPFVGHLGIANSQGIIYDFAGPYTISVDRFSFGAPTRYIQFDPKDVRVNDWDSSVLYASEIYSHRMHNLCCDNCHSHVACALNRMNFKGRSNWNMLYLGALLFFKGRFVSIKGFFWSFLPSILIYGSIIFFCLV